MRGILINILRYIPIIFLKIIITTFHCIATGSRYAATVVFAVYYYAVKTNDIR